MRAVSRRRQDRSVALHRVQRRRAHKETRKLAVKIPAGVDDGAQIRLTGEGEAGPRGAPAGDLYIELNVKPQASCLSARATT